MQRIRKCALKFLEDVPKLQYTPNYLSPSSTIPPYKKRWILEMALYLSLQHSNQNENFWKETSTFMNLEFTQTSLEHKTKKQKQEKKIKKCVVVSQEPEKENQSRVWVLADENRISTHNEMGHYPNLGIYIFHSSKWYQHIFDNIPLKLIWIPNELIMQLSQRIHLINTCFSWSFDTPHIAHRTQRKWRN